MDFVNFFQRFGLPFNQFESQFKMHFLKLNLKFRLSFRREISKWLEVFHCNQFVASASGSWLCDNFILTRDIGCEVDGKCLKGLMKLKIIKIQTIHIITCIPVQNFALNPKAAKAVFLVLFIITFRYRFNYIVYKNLVWMSLVKCFLLFHLQSIHFSWWSSSCWR